MKKIISLLLISAMLLSISGMSVFAGAPKDDFVVDLGNGTSTYYGDVLVAVNTNTSWTDNISGGFTTSAKDSIQKNVKLAQAVSDNEYREEPAYIDDNGLTVLDVHFPIPELEISESGSSSGMLQSMQSVKYELENEKNIYAIYDTDNTLLSMKCVAIGTHCTVWSPVNAPPQIKIDLIQAEAIAKEFDDNYDKFNTAFDSSANMKLDVDGDGKIAIMCYDISNNYETAPTNFTGGYIAGYFWSRDLVDENGKVYTIDNSTSVLGFENGGASKMDMIHIDTYPGMNGDSNNHLGNISRSFSTLFHEYQHYVNLSYSLKDFATYSGLNSKGALSMPTYMNEAFSMAVEQLIYDNTKMQSRIDYFTSNMETIVNGNPLTIWSDGNTLPNYSMSYVFGQYLRTQYLGGDAFYSDFMKERITTFEADPMKIAAKLLNTTPADLIRDFWLAVYLNQSTGKYGFNGAGTVDSLGTIPLASNVPANKSAIQNGGVKFYNISDPKQAEIKSTTGSMAFAAMKKIISTEFHPVTGLTMTNSNQVVAGSNLTLSASVAPSYATNKDVTWEITNDGGTGATIDVNTLKTVADALGTVTLTATVTNGASESIDFTREFIVKIVEKVTPPTPDPKDDESFFDRILNILLAPFRIIMDFFTAIWDSLFGGNNSNDSVNASYEVSLFKNNNLVSTIVTTATSYDFTSEIIKNGAGLYTVAVMVLGDGIKTANSEKVLSENSFNYDGNNSKAKSQMWPGITLTQQCVIKSTSGIGGSISQEGVLIVPTGIKIKFDIVPNDGYVIKDVLVNGVSIGAVGSYTYVSDITKPDNTLHAVFEKAESKPVETEAASEIND